MKIKTVKEQKKVASYLDTRGLTDQYKKAKSLLLEGDTERVNLKLRKPKYLGIYQFRISKKYRAFGFFEGSTLKVFQVSDHQD